jgi:hypothetical protein
MSSTPCGHNNPERSIPAADPTTPAVETAQRAAAALDIADALSLVGVATEGMMLVTATGKVHTPVIAKVILLCGFPEDSTMLR